MFCSSKRISQYCLSSGSYHLASTCYLKSARKALTITQWSLRRFSASQIRSEAAQSEKSPAHMFYTGKIPLRNSTIGELVAEAAKEFRNQECLISIHQNVRLTFGELLRRVDKFAAGLKKLGLEKGDRVAVWGPNDIEWYISAMALYRAGFIVVTINPAYQQSELNYCVDKVQARAIISPEKFKTQNYARMSLNAKEVCPSLEHIIVYSPDHIAGTRRFSDVEALPTRIDVEEVAVEQAAISCYEGCNIQFTSGTTGKPKATLVSHRSLWNNSRQGADRTELRVGQKVCLNVPFFHAFGLVLGQCAPLHVGATVVLEGPSFNPVRSVEILAQEKCTTTYGTPTMWANLYAAQQRMRLPIDSLEVGVTGGSPAPPELLRRIKEAFRFQKLKSIYGLTETTAIIFQSLPDDTAELQETTVGHIAAHVEAKVVDQTGVPVPFNTPGELWIRGYTTMVRYWDDEESTRKTFTEDGWLKTGDQFILRSDGYGHIVGRLKDMLIRGGENIFPKEIEDFLISHPQVLEAQVVGAHDEVYGEEVCACIRLRDGATLTKDELREYCRGKIAHFKIPRYIEFVDEYPKTVSGKVQKQVLKEQLERKGIIPATPKS